jgi:endonuclease/exonuclease/phosphatase (EEP) superfamily protein YafD
MSRSPNDAASGHATQSEYAEAAELAARVAALPNHGDSHPWPALQPGRPNWRHASPFRRFFAWLFYITAWLTTIVLAVFAGLRIFKHDATHFLVWVNAFTRYVYLPAYVCLAWALWRRRWILALLNLAIVGLHISWIAPDFVRDRRFDVSITPTNNSATAPRVRIFFANVNGYSHEFDSMLEEIKAADPDVIILAEFTQPWHDAFVKSWIHEKYPYGRGIRPDYLGMANTFSRLPLKTEVEHVFGGRVVRTLDIDLGDQTLRIVGVHAPRPLQATGQDYDGYWKSALPFMLSQPEPAVLIGDFNATQYSRVYQQLTATRFRSAHEDRGRGFATTWPNGQDLLPPIRTDQAFVSPGLECLGITEGLGRGSDHKPLILHVQLRPKR